MKNIIGAAVRGSSSPKSPLYNVITFFNGRRFYVTPCTDQVFEWPCKKLKFNLNKIHFEDVPNPYSMIRATVHNDIFKGLGS
jgi:hypothetical protein